MTSNWRFWLVLAAAVWAVAGTGWPARAQQPAGKERVVELTVRPAPPPRPALRWRLLPALAERTPGNAAPYYYRAALRLASHSGGKNDLWTQYSDKSEDWLSSAPERYPREEVRQWLAHWSGTLEELRAAAQRETCEWEIRPQDLQGLQTLHFVLQEVQEMRELARLARLQAHAALMDGQYAEALNTLRLGYRLGSDVSRYGLLISSLVGIAIISTMNEELLQVIQHSPDNYYWALAAARPGLIDVHQALEVERQFPYKLFPVLRDAATAQRSPEEWRQQIVASMANFHGLTGAMEGFGALASQARIEWAAAAMVSLAYPQAKARLLGEGWDRQQVEAMPAAQVVAIDAASALDQMYDEQFAALLLPYPQARARLQAWEQQIKQQGMPAALGPRGVAIIVVHQLAPALSATAAAAVRVDHQMAALQAIEALRMHAAQTGQWPDKLEEVTVVPVPKDPASDAPFRYRREQDTAILEPAEGTSLPGSPQRYVLRLKRETSP